MLRLALIENLLGAWPRAAPPAGSTANLADSWVDQMIAVAEKDPKSLILVIADMARSKPADDHPVRFGICAPVAGQEPRFGIAAELD